MAKVPRKLASRGASGDGACALSHVRPRFRLALPFGDARSGAIIYIYMYNVMYLA